METKISSEDIVKAFSENENYIYRAFVAGEFIIGLRWGRYRDHFYLIGIAIEYGGDWCKRHRLWVFLDHEKAELAYRAIKILHPNWMGLAN